MAMMSQLGFWRHVPGYRPACRLYLRKSMQGRGTRVFDLSFPSPVGLAPGFDRNGLWINDLLTLGYGFLSIDTGDISPSVLSERLARRLPNVPVFTQIQAMGPSEDSIFQHVVRTFSLLYDFTDAFVISTAASHKGISSMDDIGDLSNLLDELLSIRLSYETYRPILIRLGRNFVGDDLYATSDYCQLSGVDGLILPDAAQIQTVMERTNGRLPLIGSVPESSPDTAAEMLRSGASLLEIGDGYTGSRIRSVRPMLKWLKQ